VNRPEGGVDKQCVVAVRLHRRPGAIVVEDVDRDAPVAIARAAERVSRAVAGAAHVDWEMGATRGDRVVGSKACNGWPVSHDFGSAVDQISYAYAASGPATRWRWQFSLALDF